MKRKLIFFIILLLVIVNISALATITYKHWYISNHLESLGRPGIQMEILSRELNLSDIQKEQLQDQISVFEAETQIIMDSLRAGGVSLIDEIASADPDSVKLEMMANKISDYQIQIKRKLIAHLLNEKSILTPEQQHQFFNMFKEIQLRRGMMKSGGKLYSDR